jgi:hypothetical protein
MNDSCEHLESNVARLIQVGYSAECRPDPARHSGMLRSLEIDLRGQQRIAALPEWIVAALVGFLVFLAGWLALANPQVVMSTGLNSLYFVAAFVLILNLAFIPIASIIIVIRRRYV